MKVEKTLEKGAGRLSFLQINQRAGRAVCRPIMVQGGMIIMIGLIIVQALINVRGGIFGEKKIIVQVLIKVQGGKTATEE